MSVQAWHLGVQDEQHQEAFEPRLGNTDLARPPEGSSTDAGVLPEIGRDTSGRAVDTGEMVPFQPADRAAESARLVIGSLSRLMPSSQAASRPATSSLTEAPDAGIDSSRRFPTYWGEKGTR
jgi:hypothetical protein